MAHVSYPVIQPFSPSCPPYILRAWNQIKQLNVSRYYNKKLLCLKLAWIEKDPAALPENNGSGKIQFNPIDIRLLVPVLSSLFYIVYVYIVS